MPTVDEHITIATLKEEFGDKVLTLDSKYQPEAAIAYHYSALHWVDAYLAKKCDKHPKNHGIRESWISRESLLKPIYSWYRHLATDSHSARYEGAKFTAQDIKDLKKDLADIKRQIVPIISPPK